MKFNKSLLAVAIAAVGFSAQAELVTNGNFESFSGVINNGYAKVNNGSNAITGWAVGGTSVDVVKGQWGAISGNSIDMLGTPGPGSLSQLLNTVDGQTYQLSFELSYNNGNGNGVKAINFSFGGITGTASATLNQSPFYKFTGNYTATAASTLLSFASTGTGNFGVVLDNVSVTAVPEPETYAMLLAGLGLMGAIARRRKAKAA